MNRIETEEKYRQQAKEIGERQAERERRNDDPFYDAHLGLSAWANDLNLRLASTRADIIKNGGVSQFLRLVDKEENRILDAARIETRYGTTWILSDQEVDKYHRRFIPCGNKSRIQKKLGLYEAFYDRPAWADTAGGGRGLSGCTGVYIKVYESAYNHATGKPRPTLPGRRYPV